MAHNKPLFQTAVEQYERTYDNSRSAPVWQSYAAEGFSESKSVWDSVHEHHDNLSGIERGHWTNPLADALEERIDHIDTFASSSIDPETALIMKEELRYEMPAYESFARAVYETAPTTTNLKTNEEQCRLDRWAERLLK